MPEKDETFQDAILLAARYIKRMDSTEAKLNDEADCLESEAAALQATMFEDAGIPCEISLCEQMVSCVVQAAVLRIEAKAYAEPNPEPEKNHEQ